MKLRGKVWKFGDNIDTDLIIPGRYLKLSDRDSLAKHLMEDLRPSFHDYITKGDMILAGVNFGCGSCREHAPIAIKCAGISCVIARSFSRLFFRNSINIGLPLIEHSALWTNVTERDQLSVDLTRGVIVDETRQKEYCFDTYPDFIQRIMLGGGIEYYLKLE